MFSTVLYHGIFFQVLTEDNLQPTQEGKYALSNANLILDMKYTSVTTVYEIIQSDQCGVVNRILQCGAMQCD